MENSERQRFEEEWQEAFKEAEQSPSGKVWWAIDGALGAAEGGLLKQKLVFYKRLAAASIALALLATAATTYYVTDSGSDKISRQPSVEANSNQHALATETQQPEPIEKLNLTKQAQAVTDSQIADVSRVTTGSVTGSHLSTTATTRSQEKRTGEPAAVVADDVVKNKTENHIPTSYLSKPVLVAYDPLAATYRIDSVPTGRLKEMEIVRKLPAMPAHLMANNKRDKKEKAKENLWAALGASTGTYATQSQSSNMAFLNQANSFGNSMQATTNNSTRGSAYTVGLNMGTRVSNRVVLQGGVAYLNQSIGYASNLTSLNNQNAPFARATADYTGVKNSLVLSPTTTYQVSSVNEWISVPVQVGYLVVNRKFGLQLNSGMAADMFVQNTLTDKSGQLKPYTSTAGSDSPYNSFSWTALAGTELSYKIGSQYRLALAPGLRYSLTPVMKENVTTSPFLWDMGFRFRYIIR
ncbi:MAG: hypothetical protein KF775_03590 [Cyclobacteriaceae bacterium]|nr:hypothetical protein [Cyclobacteriaceae bacterium]